MKHLDKRLAELYRDADWHLIPMIAQVFMVLALLFPLRGGMIPAFANEYNLPVIWVKVFWLLAFVFGVGVLYRWRTSQGFWYGSMPLMMYVFVGYLGYSVYIDNFLPFGVGVFIVLVLLKIYLHLQNGYTHE